MSHFVKNPVAKILGKPYASVQVTVKGKKLVVETSGRETSIKIARPDTKWTRVPDGYNVVFAEGDGKPIQAAGVLYVSVDTLDPHHLLADIPKDQEFVA